MKRRIATTVIGAVVLALLLAGLGTFVLSRANAQRAAAQQLEQQAVGIAEVVATLAERAPVRADPQGEVAARRVGPLLTRRALVRLQAAFEVEDIGLTIIGPEQSAAEQLPSSIRWTSARVAAVTGGEETSGRTIDGTAFAAAGRPVGNSNVVVTLIGEQTSPLGNGFGWFLVTSAGVILLAALVSVRLGTRLAQPVHDATVVTSRIATGDLGARLPDPAPAATDESAVLARSINSMADTLQRSKGLEQQFLMSISHDLRTPLTSIKGYAEAISDGAAEDPAQAAEVISAEARRLERLVADLLDLASLDAHQFTLHPAPADLAVVVEGAARGLRPEVERAGLQLEVRGPGVPAPALVDEDRVVQVVGNLVGNAVHFARSRIVVETLLVDAGAGAAPTVVVAVSDDGAGIAPADLPHVFERLYQSQQQPQRRESGSGLGLAIVRELVAAMGGDVGADSPSTGGTTVWFRLPRH